MSYTFRKAGRDDAALMADLIHRVWDAMKNKDLFYVESVNADWCRQAFEHGGIGWFAETEQGEAVGAVLTDVPEREENLGVDIGLPEEELGRVMHVEIAAVLSEHTGHHLQRDMVALLEDELKQAGYRYLMCTISPDNPASLKSVQANGYRIVKTAEKYGGLTRHILLKEL